MTTIGLTGGIGMGKSAASEILARRGFPVVDTDLLARRIVEPGEPALLEIARTFGDHLLDQTGRLRRDELARLVFGDPEIRQKLESIMHPRIQHLWMSEAAEWSRHGKTLAVVVIPLLFETGAEKNLDKTICVACSPATQRQRLLLRGWSLDQIEQRLAAQLPILEKISRADFVVWNESGLDLLEAQLDLILRRF